MTGTRKRKHVVADAQTDRQQPMQRSIQSFAGVSKGVKDDGAAKKRKTGHTKEPASVVLDLPRAVNQTRKRKLVVVSANEGAEEDTKVSISKQYAEHPSLGTPGNKRFKNALPPSPAETPSKNAADLFGKLRLNRSERPTPPVSGKHQNAYDTPPYTPEAENELQDAALPNELHELIQIHAAFLTALALHYAQNGDASNVQTAELLPNITRTWKKRSVTLEDLRRVLVVDAEQSVNFDLEDCGHAGIRVVRSQARGRSLKRPASFLDHDELNGSFEDALRVQWTKWQTTANMDESTVTAFLRQLPLADFKLNASASKAAPLLARAQQRLAEVQTPRATAESEAASALSPLAADQKTPDAVHARGNTLLDRILAKQCLAASLPAGPTRAQLERKAALHRLEDIARVLEILLGPKPRASFSMQMMVQNLQQSLRHPISREEVERCMGLLADEISPGFVTVVQSGSVKAVVLSRARKLALEDLRARVEGACAGL